MKLTKQEKENIKIFLEENTTGDKQGQKNLFDIMFDVNMPRNERVIISSIFLTAEAVKTSVITEKALYGRVLNKIASNLNRSVAEIYACKLVDIKNKDNTEELKQIKHYIENSNYIISLLDIACNFYYSIRVSKDIKKRIYAYFNCTKKDNNEKVLYEKMLKIDERKAKESIDLFEKYIKEIKKESYNKTRLYKAFYSFNNLKNTVDSIIKQHNMDKVARKEEIEAFLDRDRRDTFPYIEKPYKELTKGKWWLV